ncbi:DNA polymerase I thermostable [Prunus yedoensis var. nudiflora]|uniref:DNA polymerase I thermostable n=1 Tax=Prunus yedoensis var. nudiflora TaxID=2094558 RepID=A0A314UUM1_PRUYE|nr:DNA polymerase I thermostable [Prunus yedoensis var. nudiflora]
MVHWKSTKDSCSQTVGRQYAQDALTKHADYLRRNYEILSLRRDVDVRLREEWLVKRDTSNDSRTLSNFFKFLEETQKFSHYNVSVSNG